MLPMQAPISRRQLLLSAAAASGAAAFDLPTISARLFAADKKDPWGGWPVGVQSYSLREFDVGEAVRHMQGMGVHFAEFYGKHLALNATDEQIAEVKKLLKAADIKLSAHGVNPFSKDHDANRKIFEFAKRAGIRNITADPSEDAFESLDKLCAEYNIRIAIHNHGQGHRYDKISDVVQAVKGRHKWVGACVDTGHFIRTGEDPVKAIHELNGRVFGVHMKDDTERGKGSHNVVIGKANLDVVGVFKALKETQFPADGALSLEYEANPKNPIDDMKECLAVAKEAIAKVAKS